MMDDGRVGLNLFWVIDDVQMITYDDEMMMALYNIFWSYGPLRFKQVCLIGCPYGFALVVILGYSQCTKMMFAFEKSGLDWTGTDDRDPEYPRYCLVVHAIKPNHDKCLSSSPNPIPKEIPNNNVI